MLNYVAVVEELQHPQLPDGIVGDSVAKTTNKPCREQVQGIVAETYKKSDG